MSSISFDNIWLLFLILPLAVLLTVPFVVAVRGENANGHNIASMALHVIMAVLIGLTAAGAKIVTVVTETDVYVVADVSYSANRNLGLIDTYIEKLSGNLPQNSQMGVVCFGKDYKLVTRLGENFETVSNSGVDDSETDIVSALGFTNSLFRDGVIKRIVLITDGRQTDSSDANALKRQVDSLIAENVKVDAIYIDDNLQEGEKEVQVSSVGFVNTVYINAATEVEAVIASNSETRATVTLLRDGEVQEERSVPLSKGNNNIPFKLYTEAEGEYTYEIKVVSDDDTSNLNNRNTFVQTVSSSVRVLLITDKHENLKKMESIYGDKSEIVAYVNDPAVPCSVEELCKYDEIVLADTDVATYNNMELFLESLDTAVSMFGKSLITIGDVHVQNRVDDLLDGLEQMLPVKYGNANQDPKLFTIVIDDSRSMLNYSKMLYAKQAACNLLDLLSDDDNVCVVLFHGNVEVLQPVTSAAKREDIKQKINDLEFYQGSYMELGLDLALKTIKDQPFGDKQIMLITDGLKTADDGDSIAKVNELLAEGIVTSVFDVGRGNDTGSDSRNAERLLKNIAKQGEPYSKYFAPPKSIEDVDNIVFGDMADSTAEKIVEKDSWVKINQRYDDVLQGITDVSYISGYVNSKADPKATVVLTTDYFKASGASVPVPIYAYRNYGNGKVSSFTGGFSGSWVSAWEKAGLDAEFFGKMFDTNVPKKRVDYPFNVSTRTEAGYTHVEIAPAAIRLDSDARIVITSPDGTVTEGKMIFNSSTFVYDFASPLTGKYEVDITYSYGGAQYAANADFNISYLTEYDSFAVYEASVLYKMVGGNGTVSEDGNLVLVNGENEVGTKTVRLTAPLLIACVVLFAVDIVIRKLKWNDIVSLFKKVNK